MDEDDRRKGVLDSRFFFVVVLWLVSARRMRRRGVFALVGRKRMQMRGWIDGSMSQTRWNTEKTPGDGRNERKE